MRLAFCLFNYFPYGGLQRDFIRIARACLALGHSVDVFTMRWEGEAEHGISLTLVPARGLQNHSRRLHFVSLLQPQLQAGQFDLVVGFNKMPGLDIYYAADTCYQAKAREQCGFLYRLTRRYRATVAFEEAVFAAHQPTKILLIAPQQQQEFIRYYQTPAERFHILPPGIDKNRMASTDAEITRVQLRVSLGFYTEDFLLLMVGSGFRTKGLDRALRAVAALPGDMRQHTQLYVIGKDNPKPFQDLARKLGIIDRVKFLGGRDDVPRYIQAADLLLHPAYNENTGTVLLEALAGGLPVITTDVCGYAHYVSEASAGTVLPSPFNQQQFNQAVQNLFLVSARAPLRTNALAYTRSADIYAMPERAAAIIDACGAT
jgi:UDP-glucose:(heptosyl)LPS alpha-1,3-glucosyltransferase